MNHDAFADWDAAYVLGALSPADRAAYEEHLSSCDACRAAVAEIAPIPGLLSRVPRQRAEALGSSDRSEPPPAPASGASRPGSVRPTARPGAAEAATDAPIHADRRAARAGSDRARERLLAEAARRSDPTRRVGPEPRSTRRTARARRRIAWAAASAAAVLAVGITIAIPFLGGSDDVDDTIALERVVNAPLDASVDLTQVA